jgi:serine/threonine protein kinase
MDLANPNNPIELPPVSHGALAPDDSARAVQATEMAADGGIAASPKQVGHYYILEKLGEGGMGTVYLAEQRFPVKRTVALKLIKPGFDTKDVIARFEAERQALARMDHPHITKVFDVGSDEFGRPYFAMEYVPGLPLTKFADDNKLTIRQRLELFQQVCDAIAHAHTKAIIHRDIKASNVMAYMADGKPAVKVIDFGVAKALTGDKLTDRTFFTQRGVVVGTYDSMSPEQADGSADIDTRTDGYSLGVLLYELLCGAKPFDTDTLQKVADDEVRRIIREVEPPRPSTRLSSLTESRTAAASRQTQIDALARQLRRELEWIPLKAMRKDRSRRYASPLQLSEDIGNYLSGKPLIAGPESRVYQARKFMRRHAPAIAAIATIVVLLLAGVVATSIEAMSARKAEYQATQAKQAAEENEERSATEAQLIKDMLRGAGPAVAQGRDTSLLRDILDATRTRLDRGSVTQSAVKADLYETLGGVYAGIGQYESAEAGFRAALRIRGEMPGNQEAAIASAQYGLAGVLHRERKQDESQAILRQALMTQRKLFGEETLQVADTLQELADVLKLYRTGPTVAEADACAREVLAIRQRLLGPENLSVATALSTLALVLQKENQLPTAEQSQRQALAILRKISGDDNPDTASLYGNLAVTLNMQGRFAEAAAEARKALAIQRKIFPEGHRDTAWSLYELGGALFQQGKYDEAEASLRECTVIYEKFPGDETYRQRAIAVLNMALDREGKPEVSATTRPQTQPATG